MRADSATRANWPPRQRRIRMGQTGVKTQFGGLNRGFGSASHHSPGTICALKNQVNPAHPRNMKKVNHSRMICELAFPQTLKLCPG